MLETVSLAQVSDAPRVSFAHAICSLVVADSDMFNKHFGTSPPVLSGPAVSAAESNEWVSNVTLLKGFGKAVELSPGKERTIPDQAEYPRSRVGLER